MRVFAAALAFGVAVAAYALFVADHEPTRVPGAAAAGPPAILDAGTAPIPLSVRLADPSDPVRIRFKRPPRAGLLFDVDTGQVLWRRHPTRRLPIASLTKMMTGLVATDRIPEGSKVRITAKALRYSGSGVGMLPKGKRIGISTMLHGLMLPSGNDAARAIAQRAGGTLTNFIRLMNARAAAMGLMCTRFASVDGLRDEGNHSCAADLAAIGRAVLREPRLARVVRRRSAILRFPIKQRRLFLYNHNPLLRTGYRGTTGIKTGYTSAAGRCIVATAKRGGVSLGVVLLDSPDTARQARQLLDRGFAVTLER